MIKCFIVQHIGNKTPEGKFQINKHYVARISSNDVNMFAVLDDNKNWIPFKWYYRNNVYGNDFCELYFDIIFEFFVKNHKELNEYIPTTKFYI